MTNSYWDIRRNWNTINELLGQEHRHKPIKQVMFDNQLLAKWSDSNAEGFNTHFSTIGTQLDSYFLYKLILL